MTILNALNLALTFFLELCMLGAFSYWGYHNGSTTLLKILLAVTLPLGVAALWGVFFAPASKRRLTNLPRHVLEALLFALAIAALYAAGQTTLAVIFAVVYAINKALRIFWQHA